MWMFTSSYFNVYYWLRVMETYGHLRVAYYFGIDILTFQAVEKLRHGVVDIVIAQSQADRVEL